MEHGKQLLRVIIIQVQVIERKKEPISSSLSGAEKLLYQTKEGSFCSDILEKRALIKLLKT